MTSLNKPITCGIILGFRIPVSHVQPNWDEDKHGPKDVLLRETIKKNFESDHLAHIIPDNVHGDNSEGLCGIAYLGISLGEFPTVDSDAMTYPLPNPAQIKQLNDLRIRYELLKDIDVLFHVYTSCRD